MANRFASGRTRSIAPLRDLLLSALLFAVVFGLFLWGVAGIGEATEEEKLQGVERAITKSVVQCYAVEGRYPPSLAHLEEHYGLSVDADRYLVHFEAIAENIMPQVMVFPI